MDTPPPSRGARVPCLALKHVAGSDSGRPVFFSALEKKAIDMDATGARALENDNCWATPQGWVLVRDAAASSTYLLDPHAGSSARIPLPHLREDGLPSFCTCLLSDYPADPLADDPAGRGCLVLLIHTRSPIFWYCHTAAGGGGGDEWVKHEYDIGTRALPDLGEGCSEKLVICSIAACRGKFYFNGGGYGVLGVLEFSPAAPVLSAIAVPDPMKEVFGCRSEALVESRQELFMVSLLTSLMDRGVVHRARVHRMDFSRQEWVEVDDIGGRAFLLSSWYFGASRPAAECGLEPNCVYTVFPVKKRLMVFDVKGGTTMTHDLDEAPVANQALWLLPTEHQ